ncbi:MAG: tRNA uracil 4-sulfurtransferase ThiI, partial [Planctomycetota bacterium]|nr:tRNA uracil 4-sulfurtransferase ThiI [Planctomycetota bacterium]
MSKLNSLVIRYGEIGLKGGNRNSFERTLCDNLKSALSDVPDFKTQRQRGRINCTAAVDLAPYAERAARVFGTTSVSPATATHLDLELILNECLSCLGKTIDYQFATAESIPFRITVNRANKQFPYRTNDLVQKIASAVLPQYPQLQVDLNNAELELEVDIRDEHAFIFSQRVPGFGGLPVGSMGRGMCLLSGGIDSPVAAWMCMKRGLRMEFISFYSFPHVGPQTREKIMQIAEKISEFQPRTKLHMVPFAEYQEAIRDNCPASYRTVLYRRAMQRIASVIARKNRCKALITGESLGQVASQTMQ